MFCSQQRTIIRRIIFLLKNNLEMSFVHPFQDCFFSTFTYPYNETHVERFLSNYLLYDKQFNLHHLFAGSNMLPDHHLTFLVYQFRHPHPGQYPLITE